MRKLVGSPGQVATPSRFAGIAQRGCSVTGRGAGRETAICRAIVELLNEISYESVTMDAVAARAKASKATIYRRWSNKDALVVDTLRRVFADRHQALLDLGNLRDDLLARINQQTTDPVLFAAITAALKGLAYAASSDPELAQAIRGSLADAVLTDWQTMLDRAHRRGELGRPVDARLAWEVAEAQFCARAGVEAGPVDSRYIEHVVDDVLMPVILHAAGTAPVP